jgi:hypothetical protein
MNPKQMLKKTKFLAVQMRRSKNLSIAVGLPKEKVGGAIYEDGQTIISVGAQHEYGVGVPRRSFLRVPFIKKSRDISEKLRKGFELIAEKGYTAEKSLNLVGAYVTNVSKGAFTSRGYGTWTPNKPSTIAAKGSSQPLIDTGTLRNSITWVVR